MHLTLAFQFLHVLQSLSLSRTVYYHYIHVGYNWRLPYSTPQLIYILISQDYPKIASQPSCYGEFVKCTVFSASVYPIFRGGRMAEWLSYWTRNHEIVGSSPAIH